MPDNKNKKKLLSRRESWQLNIRALKLLYHKYPRMILSRMACRIWGALTPYVGIGVSARIVEELSGGRDPEKLKQLILAALLSAALIAFVSALLNRYQNIANTGRNYKINHLLSEKMLDMDFCVADDPKIHQKISAIHQFNNGGGWGMSRVTGNFENLFHTAFSLLGGAALTISLFTSRVSDSAANMAFLNSPLFIVLLLMVMLMITWLSPMLSSKRNSYYALNSDIHTLGNRLSGYWGWLGYRKNLAADMRIYRQDMFCDKYNRDKTTPFCSKGFFAKKSLGAMGLYASASSAISSVFTILVYLFVCMKAWAGAFGIGMVTQYISSISRFSGSIGNLFGTLGDMRNNATFLKQTLDFLDTPNVMRQGSLAVTYPAASSGACDPRGIRQGPSDFDSLPAGINNLSAKEYEIEFRDVSFRYPGSEDYALRHVNIKFKAGQRLAVVGQNGSGKTTFIKLLCRLYDPGEGQILLNGIDIREYDYRQYRNIFSVVFQDFALTDYSLGQNIAAKTDYDKILAESSLEKAGFETRLKSLPQGLDTCLTRRLSADGVDMSGGERQKIAIARALYKTAPFIILDEPTAALDPMAEAEIYSRLNEIIEDRTAIYISHRLSSCRFCDDILVFDKGNIIQQGSHDALTSGKQGKYYELWHAQAQYYDNSN